MKRVGAEQVQRAIPELARPILEALLGEAEKRGLSLHLVGGPVRDLLLGRLLRDVDLVLEPQPGDPKTLARELARAVAPRGVRVVAHDRFATVQLRGEGVVVDLATTRTESYETPGALPRVSEGSLEEDLLRRDFSVNALAIPLTTSARRGRGALVDAERGLADLRAGVLRIFHDRSFHDDPTRALRAARLAPRLGFRLSRGSRTALRAALRDGAFGSVSGERFRAELAKLFADAPEGLDPSRALRLLADWHVLPALEPGLGLPRESTAPLRRLGRMVAAPPWEFPADRPWVAGLMVWMAPLDASLRRRAVRRLAVQGEIARRIGAFPRARIKWLRVLERSRGRGSVDSVLRTADDDELLALAAWAQVPARRRIVRYAREDRPLALPISGDDLVAIGLQGPAVGRALAQIRVAVLDRAVNSREEALALAREMEQRGGARRSKRTSGKGS